MTTSRPLRLWPGVAIAVLMVLAGYAVPLVVPAAAPFGMIGRMAGALAILLWWLFFSRAPWLERVGAIALMVVAVLVTRPVMDQSIRGGMMGMMLVVYGVPLMALALVAWAAATRRMDAGPRRAAMAVALLFACGSFALLRTDGINGDGTSQLAWRWTPTDEQLLLARASQEPVAPEPTAPAPAAREASKETPAALAPPPTRVDTAVPAAEKPVAASTAADPVPAQADWPGFRGPQRDGVVRGVRIKTDWSASPPVEMWRRPIGPGWSSFAVRGDLLYTQEQRGEEEMVVCYRVSTGEPVWRHRDPVRFWESNAGAGPRGTPTLSDGRVYAFGATGLLNALDARTGAVLWSRNVATDTGRRVPDWGFASSPLVIDDVVIVAASGTLAGYHAATGNKRWVGPVHLGSYSSPHRATIDGIAQVVMLSGSGAAGFEPASGKLLWEHQWQEGGATIVQPAVMTDGNILINASAMTGGAGTRRLAVAHTGSAWNVQERWTSNGLKPYFNDFVVHKGHAYGFDGSILASIGLEDGTRKWKGGRYGNGQLVLLADQDLLLVLSEEGELALVNATADQFRELARFKAIEGKTWNHPAVVGGVLLVRNGEEMAAFRLPMAGR